jgi:hypothetical protein
MEAAAGGAAAAAAANDATARVEAFMLMINFGGDPGAITPENRGKMLRLMTYMDPTFYRPAELPAKYATDNNKEFLYRFLPVLRTADIVQLQSIGGPNAGGAFGAIKVNPATPDRIWKVVLEKPPRIDIINMSFLIIKEIFIQHILCNDTRMGSFVPKVYGIYKGKLNGKPAIFVEMERGGESLATVMDNTVYESIRPNGQKIYLTPILPVGQFLEQALVALMYFNNIYNFTHRDLKMTNMIVSPSREGPQIVDFGMSCITINVEGTEYLIKAGEGYVHTTPCIEQQDMGMLLMELHYNYGVSDPYLQEFMDAAIPPSMQPEVAGTPMYVRRMALKTPDKLAYSASYNRDGRFYPSLPAADQAALRIEVVLAKLRAAIAHYVADHPQTAGGRRRTRRTRRRLSRRRK